MWPRLLVSRSSLILFYYSIVPALTFDIHSPPVNYRPSVQNECQNISTFTTLCNIKEYLTISPFNNTLGHTSIDEAVSEMNKHVYLFLNETCKSKIQLFLCSLYTPVCVKNPDKPNEILLPCRDNCEEAHKACSPMLDKINGFWLPEWECSKFKYYKDNKLCVINNNQTDKSSSDKSTLLPVADTVQEAPKVDDREGCGDLFDCQINDQRGGTSPKYICIEHKLVCNGVVDCIGSNETDGTGLDEARCETNCSVSPHLCDGKCIQIADKCDGKVDCSSGIDEQACGPINDYSVLTQSLICVLILISLVLYALYMCFIREDEPDKLASLEEKDEAVTPRYESNYVTDAVEPSIYSESLIPPIPPLSPIYQEPSDLYERIATGGYSGASSLYAPSSFANHFLDRKEPPRAPPPTPAPPYE